jgi:hypothetical protein
VVIARRSSPRVEHWGGESLLRIAIAMSPPRGERFATSPLAERNSWSRTRARSHERKLIAQLSSTTSRTRRCSVRGPCFRSVPRPFATVRARSRAQVAVHLSTFSPLHASSCTHCFSKPRKLVAPASSQNSVLEAALECDHLSMLTTARTTYRAYVPDLLVR